MTRQKSKFFCMHKSDKETQIVLFELSPKILIQLEPSQPQPLQQECLPITSNWIYFLSDQIDADEKGMPENGLQIMNQILPKSIGLKQAQLYTAGGQSLSVDRFIIFASFSLTTYFSFSLSVPYFSFLIKKMASLTKGKSKCKREISFFGCPKGLFKDLACTLKN